MKKFLAIYRGEPTKGMGDWHALSPEEQQNRMKKGMDAWEKWGKENLSKILDQGGPLGKTLQVNKDGISTTTNRDCAYVILEAESHEDAAKKFLNHPHFSIFPGENVEIMECLPIPGQI